MSLSHFAEEEPLKALPMLTPPCLQAGAITRRAERRSAGNILFFMFNHFYTGPLEELHAVADAIFVAVDHPLDAGLYNQF